MALIKNYEIHNSGFEVENAYHIISNIDIVKRTSPINVSINSKDPLKGQPGVIGKIFISVFPSKTAKDEGKNPIGHINSAMPEYNDVINFDYVIDYSSEDNITAQAYKYLKTTEYYHDAVED
jgi:hypothetical protein